MILPIIITEPAFTMRAYNMHQLPLFNDNPRKIFTDIRNYLAGRFVGATRDQALLDELIKCLFCKMYIENHGHSDNGWHIVRQYEEALASLQAELPDVFDQDDKILLDPTSLDYVHHALEGIDLNTTAYDPFGDVYEIFMSGDARGQEGQFFTPQNAVEFLVTVVNPTPEEKIIDPACGSGGFLSFTVRHLIQHGSSPSNALQAVYGVDKDQYLAKLTKTRLSLIGLKSANIKCADSLALANGGGYDFELSDDLLGKFDVVLANPPFGKRIISTSHKVQQQFELGYKWKENKKTGQYEKTSSLHKNVPPQVLFIERCLSLLKPGGRLGLVVPESLLSSSSYSHVVFYMMKQAEIQLVVGMPESLFKTSGKGGTHTKTCLLVLKKRTDVEQNYTIFMAEAAWGGRDSRGRNIDRDDLPFILKRYYELKEKTKIEFDRLGYAIQSNDLKAYILAPHYYDPEVEQVLQQLKATHDLVSISTLVEQGVLNIRTGDEVGSLNYGTGNIPFVRTSDISNWEIKIDPKQGLSEEIYKEYTIKQNVREGDILMVRDGTYLIGTCAYVTKYDEKIVYQSHLYKIRTNPEKLSPFLLLAILGSEPVQKQIATKRFTMDIIDSLGSRILEIVLPIPKSPEIREKITKLVSQAIQERIEARELARQACIDVITLK